MRKLLTFSTLLLTFISFPQSWNYSSGGNDFDGKYKTSSITGVGSNYPYNKPKLVINKFNKGDIVNFYISDSGYFPDNSNLQVLWVFDSKSEMVYTTSRLSQSSDNKTIFLDGFTSSKSVIEISKYEFINKLKSASKVSVRILNKFGKNDIKFSLSGSTKSINYVLSPSDIKRKIKEIEVKKKLVIDLKRVQLLIKAEKKLKLSESIEYIKNITRRLDITLAGKRTVSKEIFQEYSDSLRRLSLLDSINITQGEKNVSGFFDIDLFDSLNNKINTIKTVYLPKLQKKNELKSVNDLIEKGRKKLRKMMKKYKLSEKGFERIFSKNSYGSILSYSKEEYKDSGKYYLNQIDSIGVVRSNAIISLRMNLYDSKGKILEVFNACKGFDKSFINSLVKGREY